VLACRRDTNGGVLGCATGAGGDVIRTVASMAGFTPRITHQADSLELVQDMITAGLGVGLLPADQASPGVQLIPLARPPGGAAGLCRRPARSPELAPAGPGDQAAPARQPRGHAGR
jgi:DNA-binding transcriptional LysR family regulator